MCLVIFSDVHRRWGEGGCQFSLTSISNVCLWLPPTCTLLFQTLDPLDLSLVPAPDTAHISLENGHISPGAELAIYIQPT